MSDTVPNTPSKASGSAWTESEKIAILFQVADVDGKAEGKCKNITLPPGRTLISVQRMITRLRDTLQKELGKEGNGAATATEPASTKKAATPRKRKTKTDGEQDGEADNEGSPKKKPAGGRKKAAPKVKEEVKEEELDEAELDAQVDQLSE